MKRYFGFWILFLLLIVVIIAFSTGLVELPKQNERNLFQGARISAFTPESGTHKDNQDRLKVIIAVDTSHSMAESFSVGDDNTSLVNTTAFLINLLASRPNTEAAIMLMSNAYSQENRTGASDSQQDGQGIKQGLFKDLGNDTDWRCLLESINSYTPAPAAFHSDLNYGVERINTMIVDDWDDEGARYAVLIITDAKTDEKLEYAEKALEELCEHGAEVYFLLPQNNGEYSVIGDAIKEFPHINQLDISTTTTDGFTNEALMSAYLDFFSKISTRGNISMSHQRIKDEKVNSPKDGVFRYRFSVEGYHYGISAVAPEGFYIKQISVEDPGIQISAEDLVSRYRDYPYEREKEIKKDAKARSDMVFCSCDLEIDVSDVYTYYVDICADDSAVGVAQDENHKGIAAPKFERISLILEDFSVTVSPDECVKNKEQRKGTDVYAINHSKAFNIEMELMLEDEGEENTTSINDYVVWWDGAQMNPQEDKRIWHDTKNKTININFESTEFTREEELVFVIADENGNEIKKFIIDIIDEAPKINDEYMAMTAVQKKGIFFGSKSKDLRVDVKLNKNGEAEILLDGWVVDPEGQRVEYYLQRDVVSVGSYQFAVRKDDDAYYLDIEKKRCLIKRDNPIRITLFFMDENNVKNQQELEIVIEE